MATELTQAKRELQQVKAEINRLCGMRDKAALQDTDNAAAIFESYVPRLEKLGRECAYLGHVVRVGERQQRIAAHNQRVAERQGGK